jgi:hypothetical protein
VGAWQLGQPASTGSCVDSRPLGASRRRLCLHRRILALTRIELICLADPMGFHLISAARIPGLKSETWGTHLSGLGTAQWLLVRFNANPVVN